MKLLETVYYSSVKENLYKMPYSEKYSHYKKRIRRRKQY
jgi:hypothetical protein